MLIRRHSRGLLAPEGCKCQDFRQGISPADLVLGGLRLSPTTDLAIRDQLAHQRGDVFGGDGRRYPVLLVQLDMLGPQAPQRRLQRGPDLAGNPSECGALVGSVT